MLLVYFLLPIVCSGIKCNKCIESILDPNPTCTSCEATSCYILEYTYKYAQYSGHKAYEKGCLTSPSDIPTECRRNMHNNTLCTCNEEYCNTPELLPKVGVAPIPIVQCNIDGFWSPDESKCLGHMCSTRREGVGNTSQVAISCVETTDSDNKEIILATFDKFQMVDRYLLPGRCCYLFNSSNYSLKDSQICGLGDNSTVPERARDGKVNCRNNLFDKNSSCSGQYCMSAFADGREDMACVQQTDIQGIQLKPGYYNFGKTHFYICDTEMCNGETDAYGKPRTEDEITTQSPSLARPEDCCPRRKKGQAKTLYTVTLLYVICKIAKM